MVCAGDYKKGKPDPEAFLIAAARLGVKPETCLVYEDTDMGIEGATAASHGRGLLEIDVCRLLQTWRLGLNRVNGRKQDIHYSRPPIAVLNSDFK